MTYLATLPSLLCGLMLIRTDLATRRVPRSLVITGVGVQCFVFFFLGMMRGDPWLAPKALFGGLVAALVQCALALLRPGALGFGDVTASLLIGQMCAVFGLEAVLVWWLLLGVMGIAWLWVWTPWRRRLSPCKDEVDEDGVHGASTAYIQKVPFVPVIVGAGMVSIALAPVI